MLSHELKELVACSLSKKSQHQREALAALKNSIFFSEDPAKILCEVCHYAYDMGYEEGIQED